MLASISPTSFSLTLSTHRLIEQGLDKIAEVRQEIGEKQCMSFLTSPATPVKLSFVTSLSSLVQLDPLPSLLYLTSDMQSKFHNKLHYYVCTWCPT